MLKIAQTNTSNQRPFYSRILAGIDAEHISSVTLLSFTYSAVTDPSFWIDLIVTGFQKLEWIGSLRKPQS
jgi:hypothetical protein